jgi:DNA-binding MarR family transcriptional regulator
MLTPAKNCTNFKSSQLSRKLKRLYDAELAKAGLKSTQYSLLTHVARRGPISATALANRIEIDTSTLSRNIKLLVRSGWLVMNVGEDARNRIITITPTGLAKQAEADVYWCQVQKKVNESLGEERITSLLSIIDECMERLK